MRLKKSIYEMNNSRKIFADKLTSWLIDELGSNYSKFRMSVYHKYVPDGSKLVVLSYIDYCIYWYTFVELGKWFVDTLRKRLHVNVL